MLTARRYDREDPPREQAAARAVAAVAGRYSSASSSGLSGGRLVPAPVAFSVPSIAPRSVGGAASGRSHPRASSASIITASKLTPELLAGRPHAAQHHLAVDPTERAVQLDPPTIDAPQGAMPAQRGCGSAPPRRSGPTGTPPTGRRRDRCASPCARSSRPSTAAWPAATGRGAPAPGTTTTSRPTGPRDGRAG